MADVTPIQPENEVEVTPAQLHEVADSLKGIVEEAGLDGEALDAIGAILAVPDDQFAILAPGILQSFQQSVNNPNDKIALAQAVNASGMKAEDLTDSFEGICAEIDKMTTSAQKRDFLKQIIGTIVNSVADTEGIAKRNIAVPIELCDPNAKIPQYAHISDSGVDVYALDDITINPGETVLVPTGLKVALPAGYELQVRPKSGRCIKTKLRVANTPGTVDQGYRDEIKVIVENIEAPIKDIEYDFDDDGNIVLKSILHGSDFTIGKGEKFAQLVLMEVPKVAFYRVDSVKDIGEDRGGGFGSTGLK